MCFQRTYEELKHAGQHPQFPSGESFQRTYEELKPPPVKANKPKKGGFQRTYEELKLSIAERVTRPSCVFSAYL